jgi:hypothetical protein
MGKRREYKVGSTRGRALAITGERYKNDALAQAWVDKRDLAMLTIWFHEKGLPIHHMSDVLRQCIIQLVEHAVESGQVERIEYSKQANDVLKTFFGNINLNPSGRGLRNVDHNLRLDEIRISEKMSSKGYRDSPAYQHGVVSMKDSASKSDKRAAFQDDEGLPVEEAQRIAREVLAKVRAEQNVHKPFVYEEDNSPIVPRESKDEFELRMEKERAERRKRFAEKNKAAACGCKIDNHTQPPTTDVPIVKAKDSDAPRPKTDEEIEADAKRIAEKDRALMEQLDKM